MTRRGTIVIRELANAKGVYEHPAGERALLVCVAIQSGTEEDAIPVRFACLQKAYDHYDYRFCHLEDLESYINGPADYYQGHVSSSPIPKPGIYQHFKNKLYQVRCVASQIGTVTRIEPIYGVIYRKLYDDFTYRIRFLPDFMDIVQRGDYSGPRFRLIREENH